MRTVAVSELRNNLMSILQQVQAGEGIIGCPPLYFDTD
jgi:antitoxin (DNA-binding transcriptional repressor) of toxin-antitoxin stability system